MPLVEHELLESLFTAVDVYCPDPSIRTYEDFDEEQIRAAAHNAMQPLRGKEADVFYRAGLTPFRIAF